MNTVRIRNDRLHFHRVARINYTSYDVQRKQDRITPRLHPDFMKLAPRAALDSLDEDDFSMTSPYQFGRTLKIGHVQAKLAGNDQWQRVDFLFVRWFQLEQPGSWLKKHPPGLSFVHQSEAAPFGFVDPQDVIRTVHLQQAFAHGQTDECLEGESMAKREVQTVVDKDGEWEDWEMYYVG